MRCLVTGASGFVGSHLVRALVKNGDEVLVTIRATSKLWRIEDVLPSVRVVMASLGEIDSASAEIEEFKPEVIFHLAWTGGNSKRFVNDDSQIFDNLPGSLNLIKLAHRSQCGTFIYLGSCVEYGKFKVPVSETNSLCPSNLYGVSKHTTSLLSQALSRAYKIRFCGLRLFWAYGPADDELRMIPSVITRLLNKERPSLTAGEQLWDFLYIDDAIRSLIMLSRIPTAEGIFNLGSGRPRKIRDVVEVLRDLINPELELGFGEIPYAADQIMHLEADISRLRAATGWNPEVDLEEGLRRTVDWYKSFRNSHVGL